MNYSTYWSILDTPSHQIQSNIIFLFVSIVSGLSYFLIKRFKNDNNEGDKPLLLWGTGFFACLSLIGFVVLTFIYVDKSVEYATKTISSPNTHLIEGVVSNFKRNYRNTRGGTVTSESFEINGITFEYSDELLAKFNSFSKTYNNSIYNGQRLRIRYKPNSIENRILMIEIVR
ncbi:MAG: hypothetical protein ACK44D_13245 [Bacteroidia bacterium]